MGATNKILAKRVDKLTETLAEVQDRVKEIKGTGDIDEVSDIVDAITEDIEEVIGTENDDEGSDDDESDNEF